MSTTVTMRRDALSLTEVIAHLGAAGPVEGITYEGVAEAEASVEVLAAMAARRSSVIAVSPIVSAVPITDDGEAHRTKARREQMRARGMSHSAAAVSGLYRTLAATFLLDCADALLAAVA